MLEKKEAEKVYKYEISWPLVLFALHLHASGIYGLTLLITKVKLLTILWTVFLITFSALGVTIGAHRLYAHRCYTAQWQVRLLLLIGQTLAAAGSVYDWVIRHRIHHKHYGTDKDPYNHNKGFIYSQFLSNCSSNRPDYENLAREIDVRDIEDDVMVLAQKRLYWPLLLGLTYMTIQIPINYWGEDPIYAYFFVGATRVAISMNFSWLVNSARIIWGLKPGDKFPVDDNSVFFVSKTYWPNYHYLLSWDWKNGEFGSYDSGFSTFVIKLLNLLGLVSGLKTADTESIREALFQTVTTDISIEEVLRELEESTQKEAEKLRFRYPH